MAGAMRTPHPAGKLASTSAGLDPEMKCAPDAIALETRVCTRAFEAVFTRVGGRVVGSGESVVVRAFWRAVMKVLAIEVWTRILSVAMQIWPD